MAGPWDQMGDLVTPTIMPPTMAKPDADGGPMAGIDSPMPLPEKLPPEVVKHYAQKHGKTEPEIEAAYAKGKDMAPQAPQPDMSMLAGLNGMDWAGPIARLADAQTGSHISQGIAPPKTAADILGYQNSLAKAKDELASRDPNSKVSQNARALARQALAKASPGSEKGILDNMTASELTGENSIVGKVIGGGFTMQGNQAKADSFAERNAINRGNQNLKIAEENTNDPILKPLSDIDNKIQKGVGILQGNPSSQRLQEVAMDASQALNNGQISSDFKQKQISTENVKDRLNTAISYATANPDQPAPQAEVEYWKKFLASLKEANDRQMNLRQQEKRVGQEKAVGNSPSGLATVRASLDNYVKGRTLPFSSDVLQYAKDHGIGPEAAQTIKERRMGAQ